MRKFEKHKGFTLIEVLVSIAVIAVLAGVSWVAIDPVKRMSNSRNSVRRTEVKYILEAILNYLSDHINSADNLDIDSDLRMLGTSASNCSEACGAAAGSSASFVHDTQAEFGGTYNETQWNGTNNWIELTAAGQLAGFGDYVSPVVDAGAAASWQKISWTPEGPYIKELPNNKGQETVYGENNADMSGNVLLLHMNESSGALADSSGEGNNGTNNGAAYGSEGIFNTALSFDGVGDYLQVADAPSLDIASQITLEAWIKDPPVNWLTGYTYRKEITLAGQSGAGSNYVVQLKVGESSSAAGVDFHLDGHASDFPTDLRFTDNDGNTLLPYYLEEITGAAPNRIAVFWVRVADSLNTNVNIEVYYDKIGDTSNSKMWYNVPHLSLTDGVFNYGASLGVSSYHSRKMQHYSGLAAGGYHNCVLEKGGNIDCWGDDTYSQSAGYSGGNAIAVAAGGYHACALLSTGNVTCWGDDTDGQAAGYSSGNAVAVAAGDSHTCALLSTGNIDCWGDDTYSQSAGYSGGNAIAVAAGGYHACALLSTGNVTCWGDDTDGQASAYAGADAIGISAGGFHTCVLKSNGNVYCWGDDTYSQSAGYSGGNAIAVAAGGYHACALLSTGNVTCWGDDTDGQAAGYSGGNAVAVAAGVYHTCVLLPKGNVNCYGSDSYNQSNVYADEDVKNGFRSYLTTEPDFSAATAEENQGNQNKRIIDKGEDAYSLQMSSDGASLIGYISNHSITTAVSNPTSWHYVAMTYDGTNQKLYIDGALQNTLSPGGAIGTNNNNLLVGAYFSGNIDETAVYNRALSAAEITSHYRRKILRLKIQTRSCDDAACSGENFAGPDSTASTYYTEESNNSASLPSLDLNVPINRYFQYKVYLENGAAAFSPDIKSLSVDYTEGVEGYTESACLDLSDYLVPEFISQIPKDPKWGTPEKTYYAVSKTATGRIKVRACKPENNETISVSR